MAHSILTHPEGGLSWLQCARKWPVAIPIRLAVRVATQNSDPCDVRSFSFLALQGLCFSPFTVIAKTLPDQYTSFPTLTRLQGPVLYALSDRVIYVLRSRGEVLRGSPIIQSCYRHSVFRKSSRSVPTAMCGAVQLAQWTPWPSTSANLPGAETSFLLSSFLYLQGGVVIKRIVNGQAGRNFKLQHPLAHSSRTTIIPIPAQ